MAQPNKVYKFGEFQLEPDEQLLLCDGKPISLKPKVFETLVVLVESGGSLVTKDDLVKRVWPDTSATDEVLAQNISQLRRVLDNRADGASQIQTVPKRGYRFVGQVQVITPTVAAVSAQATPASPSLTEAAEKLFQLEKLPQLKLKRASVDPSAWKRVIFVLAGLVLLGIVTLSVQWLRNPPPNPQPPQLTRITASGVVDAGGGITIQGSRLIFMERNGTQRRLMQTSVEGGPELPFAGPFPNTKIHALSPDGTEWLVSRFTDSIADMPLWIVPVQGGAPLRVGDVTVDFATWFPDGKRILAARGHEVFSIDRDGRNQHQLFEVQGQGQAADLYWHPDGSRFRFTVVDEKLRPSLWEASADGTGVHPVDVGLPPGTPICCGMWLPNGKYSVFTATVNKNGDLWALSEARSVLPFQEKRPIQLTAGPTAFFGPSVSVGKRLFFFGGNFTASPVRYDSRTRTFEPYLSSSESFIDLTFSPDGQWVAYIGEGMILWRSRPDGSDRLQLTTAPMQAQRPRWSRDGKRILFVAEIPKEVTYTAFVVSAEGGAPTQVYKKDTKYRSFADWSPDGESVVIDVLAGLTPDEPLTLVNLSTGQASEFPKSRGMRNVRWSPDGRFLAATSDDTKTLYLFNAASQSWIRAGNAKSIARMEWSRDGRFLYFQDIFDPAEAVFRLNPETLTTERALDFSKLLQAGAVRCGFEGVAPDGSFLGSIRHSALDIYALDVDLP